MQRLVDHAGRFAPGQWRRIGARGNPSAGPAEQVSRRSRREGRRVVLDRDLRGIVVQPQRKFPDRYRPLGVKPRTIRPLVGFARHAQDARGSDTLQQPEIRIVGLHVIERLKISFLGQQGSLKPPYGDFAGRTAGLDRKGRQRPRGLSGKHDDGLHARRPVDQVRDRDRFVRNDKIVGSGRNHHSRRNTKRRHGQECDAGNVGTAFVVMVHRVVAYRNTRPVKRRRPVVTCHHVVESQHDDPFRPASLAMVRQIGQSVGSVEFVVGDTQVAVSQFGLDVINETQRLFTRRTQRGFAPFIRQFDDIEVVLQILVDPEGKIFMSLDKQQDMQAVLESMGEEYGIKFTPEQEKRFILSSTFGVPIRSMQKYLDLPEDQRDKILKNEGIPCDSVDNQFKSWVRNARAANADLRIAIKADATTPYSVIKNVMNSLQDLRENRYNLITSLKAESEN